MKTHFNDLKNIANNINSLDFLLYVLKVTHRNGYYAVDGYDKRDNTKMTYCLRTGMSCKECYNYLTGIRHAIFFTKPF